MASKAESSMTPSGSKGDRRAQRDFPSLQTAGRPERDYEAERRSAAENREHRRMAEGFRRVQKAVDEDMDQDGSDMCHILKMLAMAIFSRHNDSTVSSSPEEKLTVVADLVSAELQEQMKHHKAAMVGGAIRKGIATASGENIEEEQQQRQQQREEVEEEEEEERHSGAKQLISKLHRVVNDGYEGFLMASERPCYRPSCSACKQNNYMQCPTSNKTMCVEISPDPKSDDRTHAPEPGALAAAAHQIAENAVQGELLAMETEPDETVYWIVEAMKDSPSSPPAVAPPNYKPPKLGSDTAFDYGRAAGSNRPKYIQVKRLKPVTTRRGQGSVRLLEVDEKNASIPRPFEAPSRWETKTEQDRNS